jgi:branched-chain amino acid transport system ATP-binding protein
VSAPLLELRGLAVDHGRRRALHGVDLNVAQGEVVALLGANGAGKSTLLNAVAGLLPLAAGTIVFDGQRLSGRPPETRTRAGIGFSPEGRRVFPGMTVQENLDVACWATAAERARRRERIYALFPALGRHQDTLGWQLSGGQQQMLSIGRALIGSPRLLLLDEPSLGLSPILVDEVLDTVSRIHADGTTVLLAEQNASKALEVCDRAYVLRLGRIVAAGPAVELRSGDALREALLGGD